MFMCRWMNDDVSFVSARTKEDGIVMLDEWDDAEGAEIIQIRDFMVEFRLNDEGDLELAEFGEAAETPFSRRRTLVCSRRSQPLQPLHPATLQMKAK